jgi:hypothetical protein
MKASKIKNFERVKDMNILQAVMSDHPNFEKYPENIKLNVISDFRLFDLTGSKVFDAGMEDTESTYEAYKRKG